MTALLAFLIGYAYVTWRTRRPWVEQINLSALRQIDIDFERIANHTTPFVPWDGGKI